MLLHDVIVDTATAEYAAVQRRQRDLYSAPAAAAPPPAVPASRAEKPGGHDGRDDQENGGFELDEPELL